MRLVELLETTLLILALAILFIAAARTAFFIALIVVIGVIALQIYCRRKSD